MLQNTVIFKTKHRLLKKKSFVRNFVSTQESIVVVNICWIFWSIRCPKSSASLHRHDKVISSTCPSGRLVIHGRPEDLFAFDDPANVHSCSFLRHVSPSKGIHSVHWGSALTSSSVISLSNVGDYIVVLDYLIWWKTWNGILQFRMECNSSSCNTRSIYSHL